MFLKLAWRNLWRNKRRTLITAASIFLAVVLAIIMRSVQLGSYQSMIDNVVSFYYGHVQIHQRGYWDEQTIEHSFALDDSLSRLLSHTQEIKYWVPRLESFALASYKELTKGTLVVGIEPEKEKDLTHIDEKISQGRYLNKDERAVLVAEGLAAHLNVRVNDTLVLLGQGYHGMSAAGKYLIKGLIKFGSPELNQGMVYLPMAEAQNLYGTGDRITSIAIAIQERAQAKNVAKKLKGKLDSQAYEVMDWREMLPDLVQLIEADSSGGIIMIGILYMIISFGIFGTLLMIVAERKHEFGILIAIGMKNVKLAWVVVLELLMISIIGVLAGAIAAVPVISYFRLNPIRLSGEVAEAYERFGIEPIFPFSNDPAIFSSQALVVLTISLFFALYLWFKILRLNAIKAMRS